MGTWQNGRIPLEDGLKARLEAGSEGSLPQEARLEAIDEGRTPLMETGLEDVGKGRTPLDAGLEVWVPAGLDDVCNGTTSPENGQATGGEDGITSEAGLDANGNDRTLLESRLESRLEATATA